MAKSVVLPRPSDDDIVPMTSALEWQRDYCSHVGSPLAAALVEAVIDDLRGSANLADVLPERVRFGEFPGLRIMSAVHLMAIERCAPRVALHLPTLGGTLPGNDQALEVWKRNVVQALLDHPDRVAASLGQTPQTNETGRAVLLRAILSRLSGKVRLIEIGASAGLNLRADNLPGDPALESGPMPTVTERLGCDRCPIDPTTAEGRSRLSSYVWVDDVDRFARLARAMEIAAHTPAQVVHADAADFVEQLQLIPGTTTLLWHSAVWMYLDAPTRQRIRVAIEQRAARASRDARLVHASWEWSNSGASPGETFDLVWRRWGDGDGMPVVLASGPSHGPGARLRDQPESLDIDAFFNHM